MIRARENEMVSMFCRRLPEELKTEEVEAHLAEICAFVVEAPVDQCWRYYDTFDWSLFDRELLLRQEDGILELIPFSKLSGTRTAVGSQQPTFAWNLPSGPLRQRLKPIIKARALIELAEVCVRNRLYRVLNKDKKTVAHIVYTEVKADSDRSAPATAVYLCIRSLRGYGGHSRRLAKKVKLGKAISSLQSDILTAALHAKGQAPNSYSAKLNLNLKPAMRSDEATRVIMQRLLKTIEANEAGIRADIDIEFLHDYRVAIRRTRSALSQIRGVFPAEVTEHFKNEFRSLGQRTNQLRDLDVYLLAEPAYRAMLPNILSEDIDPLFAFLREQRVQALDEVIEGFDRSSYRQTLKEWEEFIHQAAYDDATAPNGGIPIIDLARKRIYKRYRRIVKDGTYILDHTEDELLHELRLECKKLRYLLEFFATLFPRKKTAGLIKELKRLQENLGDFSDLSMQQAALMSMADQLPDDNSTRRRALIATGALVEVLAKRQKKVKAKFALTFTTFAAPANQKEYRSLFKPKSKGAGK